MGMPERITTQLVNSRTWQGKLTLELACIEHAESAVQTLADIMADPDVRPAYRIKAAEAILDRAYGKPMERSIALNLGDNPESANYQAMGTKQLLELFLNRLQKPQADQAVITQEVEQPEKAPGIDFETGRE